MILPDINLLAYAVGANSPFHPQARRWWDEVLSSDQPVGLCYPSLLGLSASPPTAAFSNLLLSWAKRWILRKAG